MCAYFFIGLNDLSEMVKVYDIIKTYFHNTIIFLLTKRLG